MSEVRVEARAPSFFGLYSRGKVVADDRREDGTIIVSLGNRLKRQQRH